MSNGTNDFGVAYHQLLFLEKILTRHENVRSVHRHDDIVFEIERLKQGDRLTVVCVDAYVVSLELAERVLEAFPQTDIIYIGGKWNSASVEACQFCRDREIGLYGAGNLALALRNEGFGSEQTWDDSGDPSDRAEA